MFVASSPCVQPTEATGAQGTLVQAQERELLGG